MKAAVRYVYGPIDSIKVIDIPIPEPKLDEVRIKVMATTVNRTDLGVLTGKPYLMRAFAGFPKPRFPVTGTDFAGVVDKIGENVSGFSVGDRVWGFGDNGSATHAEFVCFSTRKAILPIPDGIDFPQIVACAEAAHYAINFLNKVKLNPGAHVLLNGGTGAIGSAAIQLLKAQGIRVTAVCHQVDVEKVKALGPDRVIALEKEDFTQEKTEYDFVFDAVGKSRFSLCKPILKPGGIYISSELGPSWENLTLALTTPIFSQKKVVFPLPTDILSSMKTIQDLVIQGKFRPMIDRTYTLNQAKEAFTYVASGKKIGNVILKIA
ncbi:MAG: NAD(P)-dependent alcohol dehydrogenase [Algoriphagus sp.]|uniref:NAD(P)-dependent alcohol dehydrogenase n=1 Tax=Algoriphagus sp. TaxID=1872435 RepID=UPI0027321A9B|nr:NAD(P)-dependent alcohol dehydrogenase [Algoriphagus sp.]MDP2041029.1 NAD(P)-dependent alcohol dehydrogenase [Algoriphagus sp.]MDP3472763.1 NAD(P)-dependent alcohol dehydrogenase [Algoriphagus sp.]